MRSQFKQNIVGKLTISALREASKSILQTFENVTIYKVNALIYTFPHNLRKAICYPETKEGEGKHNQQ